MILRCYWYCNFLNLVIDIDIAKEYSPLSLLILQDPAIKYQYWYWYCTVKWENCSFDIGIADWALKCAKFTPKKPFDSTIFAQNIDIDTEILQNKVKLRSYWYCKSQTFDIAIIEIDIAHLKKMVLIPILILLDKLNKCLYWYWCLLIHSLCYWYWYRDPVSTIAQACSNWKNSISLV